MYKLTVVINDSSSDDGRIEYNFYFTKSKTPKQLQKWCVKKLLETYTSLDEARNYVPMLHGLNNLLLNGEQNNGIVKYYFSKITFED